MNSYTAKITQLDKDGSIEITGEMTFAAESIEDAVQSGLYFARYVGDPEKAQIGASGRVVYPFGALVDPAIGWVFTPKLRSHQGPPQTIVNNSAVA